MFYSTFPQLHLRHQSFCCQQGEKIDESIEICCVINIVQNIVTPFVSEQITQNITKTTPCILTFLCRPIQRIMAKYFFSLSIV